MKTILLVLEYDGTDFSGWQVQANGVSVQGTVEQALAGILGEPVRLVSAGRTDAGVHAKGMTAHFRTSRNLPVAAYREGINRLLPKTVAIRAAAEMPAGFHARFDARGKWYRYTVHLSPVRSPLAGRTSWQIRAPLDLEAVAMGAAAFGGRHDFAAFRASGCDARETVREIYAVEVLREGDMLHFDVKGEGFLRNMVRVMVGTLVEIGRGRRPWTDVTRLLQEGKREEAGITAPPQGLCLMEVWYEKPVSELRNQASEQNLTL